MFLLNYVYLNRQTCNYVWLHCLRPINDKMDKKNQYRPIKNSRRNCNKRFALKRRTRIKMPWDVCTVWICLVHFITDKLLILTRTWSCTITSAIVLLRMPVRSDAITDRRSAGPRNNCRVRCPYSAGEKERQKGSAVHLMDGFNEHVKHMCTSPCRQQDFAQRQQVCEPGGSSGWEVRGERTHAEDWMRWKDRREGDKGRAEVEGLHASLWSWSTWISAGINCRIHYQRWKSNEICKDPVVLVLPNCWPGSGDVINGAAPRRRIGPTDSRH